MATPPAAPEADPNRPYRPPVIGTVEATVQWIAGYNSRNRSSYGQEIAALLSRFLEFATSRSAGSSAYNFVEVPRAASCEENYSYDMIISGNNLPADLMSTKKALELLISGCPDMVFGNPMESMDSALPNIFFSPQRTKFLQGLEIFDTDIGFGLKGYFMLRRSSGRYYAYPFKSFICRPNDTNAPTFYAKLAFDGGLIPFLNGMLDYWGLKMDVDPLGVADCVLYMKYDDEDVYMTRGNAMSNFIPQMGSTMFAGISGEVMVNSLKNLRFCSSESLIYACSKVPEDNQVRRMIAGQTLGTRVRGADYHYANLTSDVKKEHFRQWLMSLLQTRASGPRSDGPENWGVEYLIRKNKTKQTVGLIESRIINAIGKEAYDALLIGSNKNQVLSKYLDRVGAQGVDFFHISEGRLELDFTEFSQQMGLPVKVEEPSPALSIAESAVESKPTAE